MTTNMPTIRFPRYPGPQRYKGVKDSVLLGVVESINKKLNKDQQEVVSVLQNSVFSQPQVYVPSGIVPVDCVVCYGLGFPSGIVEIFGAEGTFKTGLLENILAEAQQLGYYAGVFPTEYSLDYNRMKNVGIDVTRLMIFDPETIEDIYDQLKEAVRQIRSKDKTTPIVFGWDSVAATPTSTELDAKDGLASSDMGKSGLQMSRFFRRMVKFLRDNRVCLICINQTRTDLGKMWGSKETTYGGKALKFYSWVRCRMVKIKTLKNGDGDKVGALIQLETVKNKVGLNEQSCRFPVLWGRGIDKSMAVFEYAVDKGVFEKKKSAFYFGRDLVMRKSFGKYYMRHAEEINAALRKVSSLEEES
jgi:recombination protein RecA